MPTFAGVKLKDWDNMEREIVVCIISVAEYKSLIDSDCFDYSQENLRKIYKSICRAIPFYNINFYIKDGFIYLFQESGKGIEYDLMILERIDEFFEHQKKIRERLDTIFKNQS